MLPFQSTLPVGGATIYTREARKADKISIHAPRGGSDPLLPVWLASPVDFNPRSPWGERRFPMVSATQKRYFNPRSPWGERLSETEAIFLTVDISIHAPRGGSDADCQEERH